MTSEVGAVPATTTGPAGRGTTRRPGRPSTIVTRLVAVAVSVAIFFPGLVQPFVPSRLVVISAGFLAVVVELARRGPRPERAVLFATFGFVYVVAVLVVAVRVVPDDPLVGINLTRFAVVLPLFLLLGRLVHGSVHRVLYVRVLVALAAVAALLAIGESVTGASLLGRQEAFQQYQRGGIPRAIVGSEHVLVLGTLLAGVVPLVRAGRWRHPFVLSVLLTAGALATGSRGPAVLAVAATLVQVSPRVTEVIRRRRTLVPVLAIGTVLAVLAASYVLWVPEARGFTGLSYSAAYRAGIYALLPDILATVPLGLGLGSVPFGVWLLPSDIFGIRDLATTVDSELVYLALTFGWCGVLLFLVATAVAATATRHSYALGASALVVTLSGLFLALHAWDSLGPFWYVLLGACTAALGEARAERRAARPSVRAGTRR